MSDAKPEIQKVLDQFGEDVEIRVIARYLQDEFMIPYQEAVELIYDATE